MNLSDPKKVGDASAAARQFAIAGKLVSLAPYGSGHINDTYCMVFDSGSQQTRYIIQRINHHIFKNPVALMENIGRVTHHVSAKFAGLPDGNRRALRLISTRDGGVLHVDADGNHWRAYNFIEGARTFDAIENTVQAYEAAKAFGDFQRALIDMPGQRLHDTIPDFHHTPKRFEALLKALNEDVAGRAATAQYEITFALKHASMTGVLLAAGLPERVTHNDTKLNNVMLDEATGEGLCVIDLDTVMPGLVLYDFGDMVRTSTSPAREDEVDLSKVEMQFPMFEALVRGYLSTAGDFLTADEKQYLAFSGKLITFEIGIRFLTDYLAGDTYFKVHREGQNLDRCRTQFRLVESIETQEGRMNRLVEAIAI